uniref:Uncharacterized protein n=1 Tax=Rangifer tarandus platyrhynchus TaxID=3082113 RepID=A0ACB0E405_RANTA|nr:unnamed protein product [Rangifer tarandus platyrhynchus]
MATRDPASEIAEKNFKMSTGQLRPAPSPAWLFLPPPHAGSGVGGQQEQLHKQRHRQGGGRGVRCCPSGSPAPHAGAHGHFPGRIYTRVLHLGMISSSQDGGGKLGSVEKGEGSCRLGVCVRARVWSKCQDVVLGLQMEGWLLGKEVRLEEEPAVRDVGDLPAVCKLELGLQLGLARLQSRPMALSFFLQPRCAPCRIVAFRSRREPAPRHQECRVLATGPPGQALRWLWRKLLHVKCQPLDFDSSQLRAARISQTAPEAPGLKPAGFLEQLCPVSLQSPHLATCPATSRLPQKEGGCGCGGSAAEPTPHVGTFCLGRMGVTPAPCGLPPPPPRGCQEEGRLKRTLNAKCPAEILLALISETFPSSRHFCCPRNAIPALLRACGPL